jgi:hypothetical protein
MERKIEETPNSEPGASRPSSQQQQQQEIVPYPYHQSTTNSGAYMFADNVPGQFYPEPPHPHPHTAYPNARYDRGTQMNFMDFTISNINDWNWGDLGNLIGSEQAIHPHMHAPQGPSQGPG